MALSFSELKKQADIKTGRNKQTETKTESKVETPAKTIDTGKAISFKDLKELADKKTGRYTEDQVDEEFVNKFLDDVGNYAEEISTGYDNIGYNTAGSTYDNSTKLTSELRKRASAIESFLKNNPDVPKETRDSLLEYLDEFNRYSDDVLSNLYDVRGFYNQWETEEEYNEWLEWYEENQRLLNLDVEGAKAEKAELEAKNKGNKAGTATIVAKGSQARITKVPTEVYDKDVEDKKAMQAAINKLQQDIALASRLQNAEKLKNDAVNASDFKLYADKGAAVQNPTVREAQGVVSTPWGALGGDKINNIVTYSRDNWAEIMMSRNEGGVTYGKSIYHYMTEDEVSIYNYYLAKYGDKKAEEYLDSIEETLNYREAQNVVEGGKDIAGFEVILAASAGLNQA